MSIIVRGKTDISLLVSSWTNQGVHLRHVDVVKLLDSRPYLVLVGFNIANKDQSVVIFNLLHRGFRSERMFDDVVSVHPTPLGCGLPGILGSPGRSEGVWTVKFDTRPNLLYPCTMHTLHHLLWSGRLFGRGLCIFGNLGRHFSCRSESSNK